MNDAAVERKPDRTHEAWLGDEISDEALEAAATGISATSGYWACPYDD